MFHQQHNTYRWTRFLNVQVPQQEDPTDTSQEHSAVPFQEDPLYDTLGIINQDAPRLEMEMQWIIAVLNTTCAIL